MEPVVVRAFGPPGHLKEVREGEWKPLLCWKVFHPVVIFENYLHWLEGKGGIKCTVAVSEEGISEPFKVQGRLDEFVFQRCKQWQENPGIVLKTLSLGCSVLAPRQSEGMVEYCVAIEPL